MKKSITNSNSDLIGKSIGNSDTGTIENYLICDSPTPIDTSEVEELKVNTVDESSHDQKVFTDENQDWINPYWEQEDWSYEDEFEVLIKDLNEPYWTQEDGEELYYISQTINNLSSSELDDMTNVILGIKQLHFGLISNYKTIIDIDKDDSIKSEINHKILELNPSELDGLIGVILDVKQEILEYESKKKQMIEVLGDSFDIMKLYELEKERNKKIKDLPPHELKEIELFRVIREINWEIKKFKVQ
jgi:hypothetical protein